MNRNKSIVHDMSKCFICGGKGECTHEVYFGSADRKKSIQYGCYVRLCNHCHNMSNDSVHFNKHLNYWLKKITQEKFEQLYGHDKFMKVFHHDYIEKYRRLYETKN